MTAYAFDWSSWVAPSLLDDLAAAAGLATDAIAPAATSRLTRLFELSGGLPFGDRRLSAPEREKAGRKLLQESIAGALGPAAVAPDGYEVEPGARTKARRVQARPRVAINVATQTELETLPYIGRTTARRIVEARAQRSFRRADELAERVAGISTSEAADLRSLLRFDVPAPHRPRHVGSDLQADFAQLLNTRTDADPAARVTSALDALIARASADRHPLTGYVRPPLPGATAAFTSAEVELLYGGRYYAELPGLLRNAGRRIDVCMFHIALTSPGHPTRRLLQALRDRKRAGVQVRVLVDRDRASDPYGSRIINRPAIDYLKGEGVRVRVDAADRLLHSKFIIADDAVVIGSHNWTAGSYFQFDDLSVLIRSAALRRAQSQRFAALWASGTPA